MSERAWETAKLGELERIGGWLPLRERFGIAAFGINAWTGEPGEEPISEHDEADSGHEELYVVVSGRATFTVDGEEIDAPAGRALFVSDPSLRRKGVLVEPDTFILTVGAPAGAAYEPLGWEVNATVLPFFGTGDYAEAKQRLLEGLERFPKSAGLLYNLACAESRLGEADAGFEHLRAAAEIEPGYWEYARTDEDLEAVRADPRFPEAS